jgi:hypothetical protein
MAAPLLSAGAGVDADVEQLAQRLPGHPQRPTQRHHRQPMATAALSPLSGHLVGRAPADAQDRGGFLDGQDLGQLIQSRPSLHHAKLTPLGHDPKLRPCHSFVN